MHSLQPYSRDSSRILSINHNGDWSGMAHVNYYLDPEKRTEFATWTLHAGDLLAGRVGKVPRDEQDRPVPLHVATEAVSMAIFSHMRSKAVSLIEQL